MSVINKSGVWLVNRAQFALHDPESSTRFEPGEPTKATLTDWVKAQPTIQRCADPSADLSEKDQAKLQAQIDADEAERLAREAAAEAAMAAANAGVAAETAAAAADPKAAA